MKFRRVFDAGINRLRMQVLANDKWGYAGDLELPWAVDRQLRDSDNAATGVTSWLPFEPISFRDFMLFEEHAVGATRQYVKTFTPFIAKLANLYEGITGSNFPLYKPNQLWYKQPIYYMSNHLSFIASGEPVHRPSFTHALDYELEIGFTISKPLFNANVEEAESAIHSYYVINDFSARDIQKKEMDGGFGPQKCKHFLSSMSCNGVTAAEFKWPKALAEVYINDQLIASNNLQGMYYSLGEVLAHVSKDEWLYPGELFGTGTVPGCCGLENGRLLQAGDKLELKVSGIGEITHLIV